MSFARAFRRFWLPGIAEARRSKLSSFESLLKLKEITLNGVVSSDEYSIYISNPRIVQDFFASEAGRFAAASFESLGSDAHNPKFNQSTGWSLIKLYYAAFFACHALLRIQGIAVTRVGKDSLLGLESTAKAVYSQSLHGGLLLLKTHNVSTLQVFVPQQKSEGSHAMLWTAIEKNLIQIRDALLGPNSDDALNDLNASNVLDEILQIGKRRGGLHWLSNVRNEVNYAHRHGAWFPYHGALFDFRSLQLEVDRWKKEPNGVSNSAKPGELDDFVSICVALNSIARAVAADIVKRSKYPSAPFSQSPATILNLCVAD